MGLSEDLPSSAEFRILLAFARPFSAFLLEDGSHLTLVQRMLVLLPQGCDSLRAQYA